MITVGRVRTQIADLPRWCAAPNAYEILVPTCDGSTKGPFYLRFVKALLTTGTLQIFFGTYPNTPTGISYANIAPNDATNPWAVAADGDGFPFVQFSSAAPPAAKMLAARYKMVGFSDAEIQNYINSAYQFAPDDTRALKRVQYDMIPAIIANRDAMMVTQTGPMKVDPGKWADGLIKLRDSLERELELVRTVGAGPAAAYGGYDGSGIGYIRG